VAQLLDTMVRVRGQSPNYLESAFRRSPAGASIKDARLLSSRGVRGASPRMRAPVVAAGSVGSWGGLTPRPAFKARATKDSVTGFEQEKAGPEYSVFWCRLWPIAMAMDGD
jgi:hypothetical protein